MTTVKNEQQFAKLIFVIGGLKMNLVRVKNNDIKVIERHPVKVLGNDYRVKIVYKNVKIAMLDVEDDTIKLTLQNKYKKMNNTQMLDLAIEKMYESIAKVEIERAMEKTRIMLGFAPEDYKIEKLKNDFICDKNVAKILVIFFALINYFIKIRNIFFILLNSKFLKFFFCKFFCLFG